MKKRMKCQYVITAFCFLSQFQMLGRSSLEETVRSYAEKNMVSALVVAEVDGEHTNVCTYGTLSHRSALPVNEHTLFRIGNLTNLFTAQVLTSLVLEERMKLTDPVSKYLSRQEVLPDFNGSEITFSHLATHTSGLPRDAIPLSDSFHMQTRVIFDFLKRFALEREPGKVVEYAPIGFTLLTTALQRVSKTNIEALFEKVLYVPLGMGDTTFTLSRKKSNAVSFGYKRRQEIHPDLDEKKGSVLYDSIGLYSSGEDMAKLIAYHLNEYAKSTPFAKLYYGNALPMALQKKEGKGAVYELSSAMLGYSAFVFLSLEKKRGFVILANREDINIEELASELLR